MGNGMNKVMPGLYLGNFRDAKDRQQLAANRITHILSIHDNASPLFEDKAYLCVHASDTPGQNLSQFFRCCTKFIHKARLEGGTVLVHCLAGVSRSVTVTVAYIITATGHNWRDALTAVQMQREVANPNHGFLKQLENYENSILNQERDWLRKTFPKYDSRADHGLIEELVRRHYASDSGNSSDCCGCSQETGSTLASYPLNKRDDLVESSNWSHKNRGGMVFDDSNTSHGQTWIDIPGQGKYPLNMINNRNSDLAPVNRSCNQSSYSYPVAHNSNKLPVLMQNFNACTPTNYSVDSARKPHLEEPNLSKSMVKQPVYTLGGNNQWEMQYPTKYVYDSDKITTDSDSEKSPLTSPENSIKNSFNSLQFKPQLKPFPQNVIPKPMLNIPPEKLMAIKTPKVETRDGQSNYTNGKRPKSPSSVRKNVSNIGAKSKAGAAIKDLKKLAKPTKRAKSPSSDTSNESVVDDTTEELSSITKTTVSVSSKPSDTSISSARTIITSSLSTVEETTVTDESSEESSA